eukprot:GHVH01001550.1.p1 GENE.GHVH01001550.1~~GHVH01001550.1.p1  ORF type:complete len:354 (+),score=48.52 GHVH01001550.1:65-1063(+)
MLDVLMGKDRNDEVDGVTNHLKINFWDNDICKYYIVDFCPHDLFPNTKSDLGPCPKLHSDQMKELYEKYEGSDLEMYQRRYEAEFLSLMESLILGVEAKIRRGNLRIDAPLPSEQGVRFEDLPEDKRMKISELNTQISAFLKQAERAGMAGRIDEAEAVSKQVAALRRQVEKLHSNATPFEMYVQRDKSLRVCHICGAMQSAADSASRFESHVVGKQHIGFEKIRAFMEELQARRSERDEKRRLHESLREQKKADMKTERSAEPAIKRDEDGEVANSPVRRGYSDAGRDQRDRSDKYEHSRPDRGGGRDRYPPRGDGHEHRARSRGEDRPRY